MLAKKSEARLGQMLVEEGLLSEEELEKAVADRASHPKPLN